MTKVTNTTQQAINEPILGLLGAMNIEGQEKNGQSQLIESTQLPSRNGGHGKDGSAFEQYEKMGIKVIGLTKGDTLFADVQLPEGWKKRSTGHSMWNELVDNKGRVRATFFYKSAFYDRDAFINFERRFSFNIVSYLPQDQTGHYEKQKVSVRNPNYKDKDNLREGDFLEMNNDGEMCVVYSDGFYVRREPLGCRQKHILEERDVWIPKFKNNYDEYNNTPNYLEVTDCGKVIFTTKNDSVFFKRKYTKKNHDKWWKDYEHVKERLRIQATNYLNELYPNFGDINAYWD